MSIVAARPNDGAEAGGLPSTLGCPGKSRLPQASRAEAPDSVTFVLTIGPQFRVVTN